MVHPENEIQNMVASQSPGDNRVAYGPARLQKSYAQLQQKSKGLHQQQESPASTVSTGSQPSILTNTTTNSADCHSSAHVISTRHTYFGTSVGYSVRPSINNGGQQREYSKENLRRHFQKGSNLNQNAGLQQRKHLHCAFSARTNFATLQGDSLKVAQTVPLKVQHSPENLQKECPLLFDLLSKNPFGSFTTKSSSEETNANMAFNSVAHVSAKRHHKGQQAGLICGLTRTRRLHHSGGTFSTSDQQQVFSPCLSLQPSTDKVLSVVETKPPTNDEIHAIISKKLAHFCNYLTHKKRSDGCYIKDLGRDAILQSQLPTTSASEEEDAMLEEYSAAVHCLALEDNSKGNKANAELIHQFNETGDCTTSATEIHSTGILVTAVENSKHSLKNKSVEESALVVFDLSVKKHLDISMPANRDCKRVFSDDCEDTCIDNYESFHSKRCNKYLENGMTTLNYSSTALKELIASLENVDSTAKTENVSKVILEQYWNGKMDNVNLFASTEYPDIMLKVGATCTKNEEESPVVLTAVPGMTWDDRKEEQPTSSLNRSSSQGEYKSSSLNSNKNLDDIDQVTGVSWALNHMTEGKKGNAALKLVGTVGLDSVQGIDVTEDPQTKSSLVVSRNETFGFSSLTRNAKQKKSIDDQEHVWEDMASARSQTNLSIAEPENELQKCFEVPLYEDISEAESQTEFIAVETIIPTLVAAPNDKQSPLENEGYGHVQGQAQIPTETLVIAHNGSESESKCGSGRQTKPSVLSDEKTTDNEMEDGHLVIPVIMFSLRFEPEDEDQDLPRTNVPSPNGLPFSNLARATALPPVQATAFPPVRVFDTKESFLLSENVIVLSDSSPDEREMDSEGDVEMTEGDVEMTKKRRGSSDSGKTEDSLDYSSASESNHMTVSNKMLRKSSAPVPSKTNDSLSEEDSEGNEVTSMQKNQTWAFYKLQKPRRTIEMKASCSKHLHCHITDDGINVNSDTEDKRDQKCKKRAKRKSKLLRSSGNSCDALRSQQKRHLLETFNKNRPPSAYSPAPLNQSKHDPPFQVEVQDISSDSSDCTEKSGQWVDTKSVSEDVQHKTNMQKTSPEQGVIIISEDDEIPRFLSSGLHKSDDPCVRPESVESECGPAEKKLQETRQSLADSPEQQSKLCDAQFRDATEDAYSDLLHSGQLIEAKGGSENVPHKANRQTMSKSREVIPDSETVLKKGHFSKRKAVTKGIVSSGSEDSSGDNVFHSKSRQTVSVDSRENAKTKLKKKNLSSEDLLEKQPVMKDANCHLHNNFLLPRHVYYSGPKEGIQFKEPLVHKQGKHDTLSSEAPMASSKKTESCEKNKAPLYRNKKVRLSIPVPANEKKQATKNNLQANARKSARVLRQRSLPLLEGPSTSFSSLSSSSRPLPVQARRSSVSSRGVYQSEVFSRLPYNPRELSFPPNKLRSCSSSSTLNHPPSKGQAYTMQLNATGNAKEQVNSYRPTRGDRKLREDNVRSERRHHDRASDERAPKKRHNHPKPATSLMKRATYDAKQWTKAINRVSHKERRDSVGEGYKWSEKQTVAKSTKGSSRQEKNGRSPPRPYL